jgi:hypothetical protein
MRTIFSNKTLNQFFDFLWDLELYKEWVNRIKAILALCFLLFFVVVAIFDLNIKSTANSEICLFVCSLENNSLFDFDSFYMKSIYLKM